jgi:tRNA(Ile2) C34 agmatinyltransferase TiaS
MIKQRKGLERIRIFLTGLREFRCRDCDTTFRGPDRRREPREAKVATSIVPRQV